MRPSAVSDEPSASPFVGTGVRPGMASLDPALPPARQSSRSFDVAADSEALSPSTSSPRPWAVPAALAAVVVVVGFGALTLLSEVPGPSRGSKLFAEADRDVISRQWLKAAEVRSVDEPDLVAAVASIAGTVGRMLGPPFQETTSVVVIRDDRPQAFCLVDGTVIISAGLLRSLDSEAELAAVLAHVLAHHVVGDTDRHLDVHAELRAGVAVAVATGSATKDSMTAAGINDLADNDGAAETTADTLGLVAVKKAAWDAGAWQGVLDGFVATRSPWLARHLVSDQRLQLLRIEEAKKLPGSDLIRGDAGRINQPEYRARILDVLDPPPAVPLAAPPPPPQAASQAPVSALTLPLPPPSPPRQPAVVQPRTD